MGLKEQMVQKMLQATSDKTEMNKKALKMKKSFNEASKFLGTGKKKK